MLFSPLTPTADDDLVTRSVGLEHIDFVIKVIEDRYIYMSFGRILYCTFLPHLFV